MFGFGRRQDKEDYFMAYKLVRVTRSYVAAAADAKPAGVDVGSKLWAYDTDQWFITYNGTDWAATGVNSTLKSTTIDLNQIAGAYDLFTATAQDVLIKSLVFALPAVNVSDDAAITGISIQTDAATPAVIISAANGVKANLTSSAQLSWTGAVLLAATKKIQLTIIGAASDAATVCKVTVEYIPITAGGYLV
jgi:hypothetical protein